MSVALMAMAMDKLGVPAVSLNAFQVSKNTTRSHGNARLKRNDTERIRRALDSKKIVIVTGFQGVDKYDDYTTLGRGGSDTTAVALAAELHADVCEIYTDVDGVYTADPRVVPNAHKMTEITYDEMLEMASLGAKVLHSRCVEIAKKYGFQSEETLTGFKYIGKVQGLLFGFEEALGYLVDPDKVRDKDGISAAIVFLD